MNLSNVDREQLERIAEAAYRVSETLALPGAHSPPTVVSQNRRDLWDALLDAGLHPSPFPARAKVFQYGE